jgi:hypothetical protein
MSVLLRLVRRPSPATLLASTALFVALGGPAMAGSLVNGRSIKVGTVSTKQIKDFSIGERDLNKALLASLLAIPPGSVSGGSVADGSLSGVDLAAGSLDGTRLAPGAIDGSRLAPDSVGSGTVIDGSLAGRDLGAGAVETGNILNGGLRGEDVGRFTGSVTVSFPTIENAKCATSASTSLNALTGSQDIADDAIVLTPRPGFPGGVSVTATPVSPNQVSVSLCNLSGGTLAAGSKTFSMVSIDSEGN